jgi:mannose-1-phosphate guanylyltransferase / mannose-6-phosphate isomerase
MPNQTSAAAEICPVILSGGVGSRLWPLSREDCPKQFQPLLSERSMLQETVLRVADPARFSSPLVVSAQTFADLTARHLDEIGVPGRLLLEPLSRGTASAVALAALDLAARGLADRVMLVLPADHLIRDEAAFLHAVTLGAELARSGKLVTLGIQPTAPMTGYGYIRRGARVDGNADDAFLIESFKEKPDVETALGYLRSGQYVWNAGIFIFRAADLLSEMARLCPAVLAACRSALQAGEARENGLLAEEASFAAGPSGSLDVLVMERTGRGAVVPADIGWSDVGSWDMLWAVSNKDPDGNVLTGDVIAVQSRNCYGRAEGGATLALIGLADVVAVAAGSTILVARREAAEQVKQVYERLKLRSKPPQLNGRAE